MNLFLLAAVPLAAVVFHRLFHPDRQAFSAPQPWILGAVWSVVSLVAVAPFGKLREFGGSLVSVFGGQLLTDALLVPGLVVAAWILTRPRRDPWELGLWLVLVFAMAGLRDAVASSRIYDLNEYFLVPLDRIFQILALPLLVPLALGAAKVLDRALWWTAVGIVVLTGPVFQVLSFAGWGWLVWVLLTAGTAGGLWAQKKAAPVGGGLELRTKATSEGRPERP